MFTVAFLQDNHNHPGYSSASLRMGGVGGTESSVIQLAEALAARGHRVYALNRLKSPLSEGGVHWQPLQNKHCLPRLDAAVGINSVRIFDGIRAASLINWLHNPPSLRQQLKRRNLSALLRHRPHAVLLSDYQGRLLSRWLPYSGRSIIHHGVGDEFFAPPDKTTRPPKAIFTSQPSRGLGFLAGLWDEVCAAVPGSELHVFFPQSKHNEAALACVGRKGIVVRGSVIRSELALELRSSRVMLAPGSPDETYCLAAAEATASGVPIVTLGHGALRERVTHNETGFVATSAPDFAAQTIRLLRDDRLWTAQHDACLAEQSLATWDKRVREWEVLFGKLLSRN